jgi:endonuclease/exonuclease/phosphatase family metal-dependent hydrolase
MRDQYQQTLQAATAEVRLEPAKSARFSGPVPSNDRLAASIPVAGTISNCPIPPKERSLPRNRQESGEYRLILELRRIGWGRCRLKPAIRRTTFTGDYKMLHIDRMSRRSLISALPVLFLLGSFTTEVQAEPIPITVATQNLYIGADLFPIFQATTLAEALVAASNAITDIEANNFQLRATAIATEIKNAGAPLLIGLQEASIISVAGTLGTVSLDYTALLLQALNAQGLNYGLVGSNSYTTSLMVPGIIDATVIDRDVVLGRTDLQGFSTTSTAVNYTTNLTGSLLGQSITLQRGYVDVDATLNGTEFQFIDTHLEPNSEAVRIAQAAQLSGAISGATIPTIVVGDFNATPGSTPYNIMLQGGLTDIPAALGVTGPTCCQADDLNNPTSILINRLDYIFGKNLESILSADLITDTPFEGIRPRWGSDHAGVVATVAIEGEVVNPVIEPSSAGIMASAMFLSVLWYGARRKV